MLDKGQLQTWINNSDLSEEKKSATQQYLMNLQKEETLKDFQIQRQKENLRITTRFLNKTVLDLEETVNLLKETNEQLNNFVKIASHDLKSPLRSISSFSALLRKMLERKLDKKEAEYFQILEGNAKSMAALIDDLLLYTQINSEALNLRDENSGRMLNEVLLNLDYDIKKNQVIIENNLEPQIINCDSIKFKQVLQNLISNSIKFSSFEGNQPHIVLNQDEQSDEWIFTIRDNGIGIEEKYKKIVFQEFKKLNGDAFEGTGMGLSIVRNIVNKHKGKIWIPPSTGQGATFKFSIAKNLNLS